MIRRFHKFWGPLTLIFICSAPVQADLSIPEILAAADTLEKKVEWVDYRLTLEQWKYDKYGYSDSLSFYHDLYLYLLTSLDPLTAALKNNSVSDRTERQRLQVFVTDLLSGRIEKRSSAVLIKDSIKSIIDSFKVDFQGDITSLSEINKIFHTSRSRSQRELACRAWYSVGEELSPNVTKLIHVRNSAASKLGFENYWELISWQFAQQGIDIETFVRNVDSLTQAANAAIFEATKSVLGINQLELWDIPFSFSQVNERGENFFPAESHFIFLRRSLAGIGFNIEKLPIFIDQPANPGFTANLITYFVKPPHDTRILTNPQNGYAGMHSLMYQSGMALYASFIAQDRPLFNFAADPTWQMAMGEIIAAMINDSTWLNDIAGLPAGFISQYRQSKFEQNILKLRILLVDISFIREAHIDPDRNLNKLYWDFVQKFTGIPRHEDIIIWSTLPELSSDPMIPVRELVAKAIAAQSVNYMTSYFGPLVNNLNTSSFLIQNYYRFGSRYAWSELLQRGTGEKLSPVHLRKLF